MLGKDKVKMSMFLPPEVAQAVKVQAARQGTGVSESVAQHYLCACCGQPILDEFVVGVPRPVGPGKLGVMYHRNREACLAASGGRLSFFAPCPVCNAYAHQSFEKADLRAHLQDEKVSLYCIRCDHHWTPSPADAQEIAKLLEAA